MSLARCDEIRQAKYMITILHNVLRLICSEMIAHHCHYSNSQAHHAQAGLVEKDRQPPRESYMSRNFPWLC
jgi:hypothetical protein